MSNRRLGLRGAALLGLLVAVPIIAASRFPTITIFDRVPRAMKAKPKPQRPALVELEVPSAGEVHGHAFTLDKAQDVRIQALGADVESARRIASRRNLLTRLVSSFVRSEHRFADEPWMANAWILDARTREVVWELSADGAERQGSGLMQFDGKLRLPAGGYEAYYSFHPLEGLIHGDGWTWLGGDDEVAYEELGLRIEASGRPAGAVRPPAEADPSVIVSFTGLGDDVLERTGLKADRPLEVEIRAIGEAAASTTYDYGWLIDAKTRERVWEFTYDDSRHAGGAEKNRVIVRRLELPAGEYAAFFVTDDSHSAEEWNSPPPYDPGAYGLTIRVLNAADRTAIRTFPYEPVPRDQAIVMLTGVGDDEYRSEGFTIRKALGIRIFALGEGEDGELYDRAWISDATSGALVWDMRETSTAHAGGASKNRLFDGVIRLEPGNYIVHYVTDDSHSAEEWNDAPPAERAYWGVTVLPATGSTERGVVARYDPDADPAIIARIVGARDNQVTRGRFTMAEDGAVRIYAVGEGVGDRMVDYAWIHDVAGGERVWEMRYEATEHAGGAEKNRVFDGAIRLAAGEYELVYRTDDSHAFGAWNATAPRDPHNWGVRLYRVSADAVR